jgi:hypothetical protein
VPRKVYKFFIGPDDERICADGLIWEGCVAVVLAEDLAAAQVAAAEGLREIGGSPSWLEVAEVTVFEVGAGKASIVTLLES